MVSENYVYFLLDFIASVNCQTVVFVYISTAVCMESISISSVAYLVYQVEQSSSIDDMNMYSHIVMPSNFNRCFSLFGAAYIRQYCNALEYSHFSAHMAIYRKEKFNQDEWRENRAATMSTETLSLSAKWRGKMVNEKYLSWCKVVICCRLLMKIVCLFVGWKQWIRSSCTSASENVVQVNPTNNNRTVLCSETFSVGDKLEI